MFDVQLKLSCALSHLPYSLSPPVLIVQGFCIDSTLENNFEAVQNFSLKCLNVNQKKAEEVFHLFRSFKVFISTVL